MDRIGQRYGQRPSEILGIRSPAAAFDFDAAVMVRADRMERGGITDPKLVRERRSAGFASVKALQARIRAAKR